MLPYERFEAWQLAHQLVLATYRVTGRFPDEERYGLRSQARRAAFSVAANIAEGSAKRGNREFRRFVDISLGSLSELAYILRLARDLDYLTQEVWSEIDALRDRTGQVVWGLYRSIMARSQNHA